MAVASFGEVSKRAPDYVDLTPPLHRALPDGTDRRIVYTRL